MLTFEMLRNRVTPSQEGWILTRLAYPSLWLIQLNHYSSQVGFLALLTKGTPMKKRSFASTFTLRVISARVICRLGGTQPCLLSDV